MTIVKNTTLDLSVDPRYVSGWGLWEALREFLQNGLDAHDQGFPLTVTRSPGQKQTIKIANEGTTLSRSTLLLGASGKGDGASRGHFGEGYKLALLVAARYEGIAVQIRTADEMWTAEIGHSDAFGAQLLKVKIRQQPTHVNRVEVQVHGVPDDIWQLVCERMIDVPGLPQTTLAPGDAICLEGSKILLEERCRGLLFCRGIYVGKLPGDFRYGYDLAGLTLDRDRKMADPYSLQSKIANLFQAAVSSKALRASTVFEIVKNNSSAEAQMLGNFFSWGRADQLAEALAGEFETTFGKDTLPVESIGESIQAQQCGMESVVVSRPMRVMIESVRGASAARLDKRGNDVKDRLSAKDLTPSEMIVWLWAEDLVRKHSGVTIPTLSVVRFFSEKILGQCASDEIRISHKVLSSRRSTLATLVHEVAHLCGADDGTVAHRDEMDRIYATIIDNIACPRLPSSPRTPLSPAQSLHQSQA